MGISLSYSKSRDLAQEITNDSFMKCFDSFKKMDQTPPLKAWLRRITVNTAIDYYRKDKRIKNHQEADGETPVFDEIYAPDQLALRISSNSSISCPRISKWYSTSMRSKVIVTGK